MRRLMIAAALTAVALSTAACGSDPEPSPTPSGGGVVPTSAAAAPASAPDPCGLVTKEEAAAALGEPVDDGIRTDSGGLPGQRDCQYFVTGSVRMTGLSVIPGDQALWEQFKSQAGTTRALSGLGDEAFAIDNMIYVRAGNLIMLFSALSTDGKGNAVVAELAPKALARV
jgi:hypothetical protein